MFYKLPIKSVDHITDQAVCLTFDLEDQLKDKFQFKAGQYLTFKHHSGDEEIRRSYSICCKENSNNLQVGIKAVEGGVFSQHANNALKAGEILEVMAPEGKFVLPNLKGDENLLFIAAGSGITPILSQIQTMLYRFPDINITLIYSNKNLNSIMFKAQIEDLKDRFLNQLTILHIFSGTSQDNPLFSGRIDEGKITQILKHITPKGGFDFCFICGPYDMIMNVKTALEKLDYHNSQIKFELFNTGINNNKKSKPIQQMAPSKGRLLTIEIDHISHNIEIRPDQSVLDAALEHKIDAPFSCRGGICSTCRCKILEGSGEMLTNFALEDHEVEDGYALSCQLIPTSESIKISYDEGH